MALGMAKFDGCAISSVAGLRGGSLSRFPGVGSSVTVAPGGIGGRGNPH